MIATWPCPTPDGNSAGEYGITFDQGRSQRLLVIPALFNEANLLRRLTVEVMRQLDTLGIDTFLPDLPGCNESVQPLAKLALADWHRAMTAAAIHFRATTVLAIRGGALVVPALPGLVYAPVSGASILRQMIRARTLSAREAGRDETPGDLLALGLSAGLDLAGYSLSSAMITALHDALPAAGTMAQIAQSEVGGSPLWLRAEPDDDPAQAQALAARVAAALQS